MCRSCPITVAITLLSVLPSLSSVSFSSILFVVVLVLVVSLVAVSGSPRRSFVVILVPDQVLDVAVEVQGLGSRCCQ
jgi:hypothetical protein